MTPSPIRVFRVLAVEALADAMRRRIVPVVVVVSLLSLSLVDRCSAHAPTFTRDGQAVEIPAMAGWGGFLIMVVLGLWTLVLAGILASDHLAEALDDGSAALNLARPVSRESFVLARLFGAVAIAVATGGALLLVTALLLSARHGLALDAAFACLIACALGATCVGGLSMAASLFVPRAIAALLAFVGVSAIAALQISSQLGMQLTGLVGVVERYGPPLVTAMLVALAPWIEPTAVQGAPLETAIRAFSWAGGGAVLLALAFRRVELGR
jgi:hypothetical protein